MFIDVLERTFDAHHLVDGVDNQGVPDSALQLMIQYRVPLPCVWLLEAKDGSYTAVDKYTHKVLATLDNAIASNEGALRRRFSETPIRANIIRAGNSPEEVARVIASFNLAV